MKEYYAHTDGYERPRQLLRDHNRNAAILAAKALKSVDLEHTAYALKPELKEIADKLAKTSFTMMTGSGSTLVVFSKKREVLDALCQSLPDYFTKIITKLK